MGTVSIVPGYQGDGSWNLMPKIDVYQTNWSWGKDMDKKLAKFTRGMFTLNFPCGMSPVGDVRADILPELKPDIICDLLHPPFRPGVFDCVICDPPFSLFNHFKWLFPIKDACTKNFDLSTPKLATNMKGFKREVKWTSVRDKLFMRPWILYTKKNQNLPDFFKDGA